MRAALIAALIVTAFLGLGAPSWARLVPVREAREGVFDARKVVIVRHLRDNQYLVESSFLGEARPDEVVEVPDFRLYTIQDLGPELVDPITEKTHILMFLRPIAAKAGAWEVTAYGYCFFWTQDEEGVGDLKKIATAATALRASWEKARDVADPRARVEALWPFLDLRKYGVSCLHHTEDELARTGAVAGDVLAGLLPKLPDAEFGTMIGCAPRFGGASLHRALRADLDATRARHEAYLRDHGIGRIAAIHEWNKGLDAEVKDCYGRLYYGLCALAGFHDAGDLPAIRGLGLWAAEHDFRQVYETAISAFRVRPEPANLPVVVAILKASEPDRRDDGDHAGFDLDVVLALNEHKFPATVSLLAPFLGETHAGEQARIGLSAIVGEDLGPEPAPWLRWYEAHKPATEKRR